MTFDHARRCRKRPPLLQVPPGFAPKGCHSSPGLKAWGFLAWLIKQRLMEIVNMDRGDIEKILDLLALYIGLIFLISLSIFL
jgi:hypothetical protein